MAFFKGHLLPPGHALIQRQRFEKENPDAANKFPRCVCYSLAELEFFINAANKMFNEMAQPPAPEARGCALMLGVHTKEQPDDPYSYADDKVTIMMVASIWEDSTTTLGRASSCDNHVVNPRPHPLYEDDSKDTSYDAGSLWP